jgi:hypothetical protein
MAETPWEEVPASTRIWLRLKQAGVRTVEDLSGWTAAEILALPGLHRRSLAEIKQILAEHGLSLRQPHAPRSRWTGEQREAMAQLRRDGATYADIGRHFSISREWARQLLTDPSHKEANKR